MYVVITENKLGMYNTYFQIMIKATKLSIYYILYYIGGHVGRIHFDYFWLFKLCRQFEKWVHRFSPITIYKF